MSVGTGIISGSSVSPPTATGKTSTQPPAVYSLWAGAALVIRCSSPVEGAEPKEGHVTRSADGVARKVGRALSGESAVLPHPQEHGEPQ